MQTDDVVLTVSSFAGGRDVAVGLIALSARYALIKWVADGRIDRPQIGMMAWRRLELEAVADAGPRRLPTTSAVATALFGHRRTAMSTEYVSRFPMSRPDTLTLQESLESLMRQVAIDIKSTRQDDRPLGEAGQRQRLPYL